MRQSRPIRQVEGGYQALVSTLEGRIYVGTYDLEQEARYAHYAAQTILGNPDHEGAPTTEPDNAAAIVEKVKARLEAHSRRPGRHHRSPSLVRRDNASGFKGTSMFPRPWRAHISKDRRRFSLGTYPSAVEATVAYNLAATILHGPDAILNPIPPADEPTASRLSEIRHQVHQHLGILTADQGPCTPGSNVAVG